MSDVCIVPFTGKHIGNTYEWISDVNLRRQFLVRGAPTWNGNEAYFEKVLSDISQRVYAIMANNTHIGNCGLKNISLPKREAELWIYIGEPSMRGKGIGRRAVELLLSEGVRVLGLEMILVHVADFNTAAIRMYQHIGFCEVHQSSMNEWADRGCRIIRMEFKKS